MRAQLPPRDTGTRLGHRTPCRQCPGWQRVWLPRTDGPGPGRAGADGNQPLPGTLMPLGWRAVTRELGSARKGKAAVRPELRTRNSHKRAGVPERSRHARSRHARSQAEGHTRVWRQQHRHLAGEPANPLPSHQRLVPPPPTRALPASDPSRPGTSLQCPPRPTAATEEPRPGQPTTPCAGWQKRGG